MTLSNQLPSSGRVVADLFMRHARCASVEMRTIAGECRVLLARSGVLAPALWSVTSQGQYNVWVGKAHGGTV
jgi:hypothetical protein